MIIHKDLASGRWFKLSLVEQLANVGVDIERTIKWRNKGELEMSKKSFECALEFVDHFVYDNEYNTTDKEWQDYFFQFNYMAALRKGK